MHFVTYEKCIRYLNPTNEYSPIDHIVSGGLAGGVAAALTTPMDNLKTNLNTQCSQMHVGRTLEGSVAAAKYIYNDAGMRGFLRGLTARVVFQVPATAICWSVYEFFKASLSPREKAHVHGGPGDAHGHTPASDASASLVPPLSQHFTRQ